MFREGINKQGLIFFLAICLIILIYLIWQSGSDFSAQENNFQLTLPENYQVQIIYPDWQLTVWRVGANLRIRPAETLVDYYLDETSGELWLVRPEEKIEYQINAWPDYLSLNFDPQKIIALVQEQSDYQKEAREGAWTFNTRVNGQTATIDFQSALPSRLYLLDENKIINYIYEQVNSVDPDVVIRPNF